MLQRRPQESEPIDTGTRTTAERRLRTQQEIADILASASTVEEASSRTLAVIGNALEWDLGVFWRTTGSLLLPVQTWHRQPARSEAFEAPTREARFRRDEGLPGRVWSSGEPAWIADLSTDENFPRGKAAAASGLVSGFAFPLLIEERVYGVIEFFASSRREREQELLSLMGSIGRQIGQFVARKDAEEAHAGTEASFRAVVDSASDAIVTIDHDSIIRFANRSVERVFGYEPSELVGKELTILMPPEMRQSHRDGIARYLETGKRNIPWQNLELPAIRKDGTNIIVAVSFGEYQLAGRRHFTGILRDVTAIRDVEQKNVELARQVERERERLHRIVSTVPGVVWEAWGEPDHSTQRIDFVSDYVESLLGYSIDEWLSQPNFWLSIVHPDDRAMAAQKAAESFAAGGGSNSFRWVARDGSVVWVEARSVVIYDENGAPVGMRGVTMDITEKRMQEERERFLTEAAALLGSSLDYNETLATLARLAVPRIADWCAIDVADDDGRRKRLAVAHVDPEKVALANELEEKYPPPDDAEAGIPKVFRTGEPEFYPDIPDEVLETLAVDERHLEIIRSLGLRSYIILPLISRGAIHGTITLVTAESGRKLTTADLDFARELADRAALAIDNSRLYQEARTANRAKDEFLATLSHELRTPMTAILGWSRLLKLGDVEDDLYDEAIETIVRSAETQAQLIDDVLDVSRIISGKMRLDFERVDLARVIRESIATVQHAADAKKIDLELDLRPVPPIYGDASRLQQILWNLVSNAIKFTPRGGAVKVQLAMHESLVRLVVEDTGEGIDPSFLAHIFERFRQAESSTTRRHGGLGLGLAIVRHLVELHGGDVSATSEGRDKGSRFVVDFPIAAIQEAPQFAADDPRATSIPDAPDFLPDLNGLRVLIVDDERDARRLITAVLERCGAVVRCADSVREAVGTLETWLPQVVLSDIGMPEHDGYELARRIRTSSESSIASLPLIALTAYGREDDRRRILASGFEHYIRKPADPATVATIVGDAARKS